MYKLYKLKFYLFSPRRILMSGVKNAYHHYKKLCVQLKVKSLIATLFFLGQNYYGIFWYYVKYTILTHRKYKISKWVKTINNCRIKLKDFGTVCHKTENGSQVSKKRRKHWSFLFQIKCLPILFFSTLFADSRYTKSSKTATKNSCHYTMHYYRLTIYNSNKYWKLIFSYFDLVTFGLGFKS